jgi:hypothetical protein
MRSRNNTHLFVVCYADGFYDDVPLAVRNRGPWGPVTAASSRTCDLRYA